MEEEGKKVGLDSKEEEIKVKVKVKCYFEEERVG
jgi:hypothetical protein